MIARPEIMLAAVAILTRGQRQSRVQPKQPGVVFKTSDPFQPGVIVLSTLANPREKFWGAMVALTVQGISLSGLELGSFEDSVSMIKAGDLPSFGVVFFPMHRIERVELELPEGRIPSFSERFMAKTGLDPASVVIRRPEKILPRTDI
jgi:hypothetical protein